MEHNIREEGASFVVSFVGDVDLEHSPKAREVLLTTVNRGRKVLVDLSGVDYIDSSGVASLVEAFKLAKTRSQELALTSVSASAMRVLQLARLDKVFTIHASVADGL